MCVTVYLCVKLLISVSCDETFQFDVLCSFDICCRSHLKASFDILQKAILSRQSSNSKPRILSGRYNRTVSSSSDGNDNLNGKEFYKIRQVSIGLKSFKSLKRWV